MNTFTPTLTFSPILFSPSQTLALTLCQVKVINSHKHHPFFLHLSHWAVHNPLQAAKADYDALSGIRDHNMRVYAGMIRALDRSVERCCHRNENENENEHGNDNANEDENVNVNENEDVNRMRVQRRSVRHT